jgi:hypothetical protein
MPYIKKYDRPKLDAALRFFEPLSVGELNYVITKLCRKFIAENGERYESYNALIGVLECAKLELYRTKISEYEELKRLSNGDV